MHARNVVHRDIKPENIVLARSKNKDCSEIRLIDFGEATIAYDDITYDTVVGTLSYLAPERFYHHKGWELKGSLSLHTQKHLKKGPSKKKNEFKKNFFMRTKNKCFVGGDNEEKTKRLILRNYWHFPSEADYAKKSMAEECQVSPLAKHFVRSLLTKDPRCRPSAKMVLTHPWFLHPNASEKDIDKLLIEWNTNLLESSTWTVYEPAPTVEVNIW
ncbi:hypothetical protein RFI_11125 [Reticulomyxa filosa]|uniref:Protein kinase domain-containing protein n=1 Tax=Reticulomyxa filosa TaxID=46433 RepID=X6NJ43_RETFI|nr:hypothetical protein RFI_11125 [Reticulomyxa filosa]|eukprot:ETO26011.1 hypothetical protein RFI_11125 [Reticulomyxa filosa]